MTHFDPDPRNACAFVGEHEGVSYTCHPHRHGRGMVLQLTRAEYSPWKDRAAWLAEALGGRWARGHQPGYRIARTRAGLWHRLFVAGVNANVPLFDGAPTFERPGDPTRYTLRQIAKLYP